MIRFENYELNLNYKKRRVNDGLLPTATSCMASLHTRRLEEHVEEHVLDIFKKGIRVRTSLLIPKRYRIFGICNVVA
jgi:hypothetical protein